MNQELKDGLLAGGIVVAICALALVFILRAMRRGRQDLENRVHQWAKGQNLRIVSKADRLWGGPFFRWTHLIWDTSGIVFRIVAEDREGRRRIGHLEFRGSEAPEVRWDD